jgi:hypothetical protein
LRALRSPRFNITTSGLAVDMALVPPRVFSRRLGILINTLYQQLISFNDDTPFADHTLFRNISVPATDIAMFAAAPPPLQPPPGSANATRDADFVRRYNATQRSVHDALVAGLAFVPVAATATTTTRTRVFVCEWAWLGVLLLASTTLFLAGAAALVLPLRSTLAPDMLRYVASMTYTNRHFPTPAGGSALDGMARARLLRDVPVRIGVVASGDGDGAGVGEVAFAATSHVEVCALRSRRRPTGTV